VTLVVQRNPARGAIAFAFAIIGVCGLFLLLAAPFLMAVTIIVYAGAIIVTFLFVLMLSRTAGPSNENDRSREPLLGSLAGFAFVGTVLWVLYITAPPAAKNRSAVEEQPPSTDRALGVAPAKAVPIRAEDKGVLTVLTQAERLKLREALQRLQEASTALAGDLKQQREHRIEYFEAVKDLVAQVVGAAREDEMGAAVEGSLMQRLVPRVYPTSDSAVALYRADGQTRRVLAVVEESRTLNWQSYKQVENQLLAEQPDRDMIERVVERWQRQLLLLLGQGEMPARTVSNLGYLLYSEYLLAIEIAGVLLLIATVGAVIVAQRPMKEAA
jgi:NADH:ubiquinone oxidoreductase subunit 6 (subunit J)